MEVEEKRAGGGERPQVVHLKNDVQKEGAMEGDGEMAGKG